MGAERLRRYAATHQPANLRHGEAKLGQETVEWRIWNGVMQSHNVCERWKDFGNFVADVGRRPEQGLKLCRVNTERPFEPGNVRWATAKWMARNRKPAKISSKLPRQITLGNETRSILEWSEVSGIKVATIRERIQAGWDTHRAIFEPANGVENLRRAWAEGRVRPRQPIYSKEELKERQRVQRKIIYQRDPQKKLQAQREFYARNPDYKKQVNDRYAERHREKINAKAREIYKKPERKAFAATYRKKHRAENPELYRTYSQNRRGRKLGAGTHTKDEWVAKLAFCGGCCTYCGSHNHITRDHDVPLSRGGSNRIDNIVPACRTCNSRKHDMTGDEYRARLATEKQCLQAA